MTAPRLVTAAEAAIWTGRPEPTLRRWVHEGRIHRYGPERSIRYDLLELPEKSTHQVPPRQAVARSCVRRVSER